MTARVVDVTEQKRLNEAREAQIPWKKWGPYLSERQWGTVREDYSEDGNAWDYFTHDQSRSRAYRWGEDGLGGISDDKQRLCFALALWNERDPILKERLYGDEFKVQCPTGSGQYMTLFEVARDISRRLAATFLRDANGRRPVYGGTAKFQDDPHWRDLILFYEYFHGDNGAGLGASHQTGWTGSIAALLDLFGRVEAKDLELSGVEQVAARLAKEQVRGAHAGGRKVTGE